MQTGDQTSQAGGLGAGVPTTPPPTVGSQVPGAPDANQKAQQILAQILQAASRKQMAQTAVPSAIPGMVDPNQARQIGMNTASPHAWGTVRFLRGLAGDIKNAVTTQKQQQLLKAEGDWNTLQAYMNEKFAAEQSGNPQAIQAAEQKLQTILGDPKKLKNLAKALNQDWLNPEKTTVYGEALKRVAGKSMQQEKQQQAQQQQKQQAAQGLKQTFQQLIQKAFPKSPQLTPDEQKRMAGEIEKKAPVTTPGMDAQSAMALREELKGEQRQAEESRKEQARAAEEEKKEAARLKEEEQKQEWQREELQMKQKYDEAKTNLQNQAREHLENLRTTAAEARQNEHDATMLKALGMKLDAQTEKMFRTDPAKIGKEVTDSVGTLKQQLAQASQTLRSLKTSASNHWLMGPGKDEIQSAQDQVDSLQKAIAHIEKNRDAIIKGKADLGEVVNKAYDIMGGASEDVPGFKPDK